MKLILLVAALVVAVLGALLAIGAFSSDPDAADLFAVLFVSLACYFGSVLAPR